MRIHLTGKSEGNFAEILKATLSVIGFHSFSYLRFEFFLRQKIKNKIEPARWLRALLSLILQDPGSREKENA